MTTPALSLVVLAGGSSRRWGGRDKTAVPVLDGEPLLAHVVRQAWAALGVVPTVVVAPSDHPARSALDGVAWVLEDPAGGGPAAGLAAGVAVADTAWVAVLAADLPQAAPALARLAATAAATAAVPGRATAGAGGAGRDGAIGVDPQGRRQHLLAVLDRTAVERAVRVAAREAGGTVSGLSLRSVLHHLQLTEVPVSAAEAFDLDAPADLTAWRLAREAPKVNDG